MKRFYAPFILIFSITLISCEKDFSEENGAMPLGNTVAPANNNALVNNYCKDCNYIPQCNGSVYRYSDTTAGGTGVTTNQTFTFEKDTVVSGATFRKFIVTGGAPAYMNCQTNSTTILSVNGTSTGGTSLPLLKLTMLKANSSAGTTWNDNATVSGIPTTYTSTLVSKNITKTVLGNIYPDVMHVRQVTSAMYPGIGNIAVARSDYFYAKGIGLIEAINTDELTGMQVFHRVLVSATIP